MCCIMALRLISDNEPVDFRHLCKNTNVAIYVANWTWEVP